MIINNSAILIIGGVLCFLGSIPTLCLCCCKNETTPELIQNKHIIKNYK